MLGRALTYAGLGTTAWLWGYVYGHAVGGREGVDSDPGPYESEFRIVDELHAYAVRGSNGA